MRHSGGRRGGGGDGSPMGRVYRETTPAMLARVTALLDDRISIAERYANDLLRGPERPRTPPSRLSCAPESGTLRDHKAVCRRTDSHSKGSQHVV